MIQFDVAHSDSILLVKMELLCSQFRYDTIR